MLRDAGVRTKLLAVLAIPTLLLVVATSLLVGTQVTAAGRAGQVKALTDVAVQVNRVVHSLQEERSATLAYLQDPKSGSNARMTGQRQYTDQQLGTLRSVVAESSIDSMAPAVQAAVARSSAGHDELAAARRSVDAGRFFATESDVFYSKIIRTDLDLPGVVAASGTTALAQRLQAYEAVSTAIEYASHERDLVETALLRGSITEVDFAQAAALVSQQRAALADFQRNAPAATFAALDDALASAENSEIDKVRRGLTDLLRGKDPDYGRSVEWVGSANSRIGPMTDAELGLVSDIATVAARTQGSQEQRALAVVVAAFLGLGFALWLAVGLARRITRPLRRLTAAAGEIGDELPRMVERMQAPGDGPGVVVEPIPVESTDEIGRLAEAFNAVNDVTVQVAKEQAALRSSIAEMFVNVARRNQVLLGRQLSQLDRMESHEEDPDVLDSLFKLDHLATRMRRNAESLLVLAGIDSTRRLRQPLPLSDVIRTALGEIEAFDRIDLSMSEDPDVSGRHALTVAHLLAELLENATHFSNPETRVVVSASVTGHGVDLNVTDYGLGMSEDEVVEANARIAHPPVAEIAVSQRLGLFVVGRLSARLGASVVLRRGRSAGLVAAVTLPTTVFEGMTPAPTESSPTDTTVDAPAPDAVLDTVPDRVLGTAADGPEADAPALDDRQASGAVTAPAIEAPAVEHAPQPTPEPMVPELAPATSARLPSRRTAAAAAPVPVDVPLDAPAAEHTAAEHTVAEHTVTEHTVTEQPVTGDPVVGGPVSEDVPPFDPPHIDGQARRGLFARWSRTPAEGVSPGVGTGPGGDDDRVELLSVESPADALSVELEVEMVALAPAEPVAEDSVPSAQDVAGDQAGARLVDDADDAGAADSAAPSTEDSTPRLDDAGDVDVDVDLADVAPPVEDSSVELVQDRRPGAGPTRRRGLFARWSRTPAAEDIAAADAPRRRPPRRGAGVRGRAGRARAAGGRRAGVRGRAGRARAAGGRRAGVRGRAGRARAAGGRRAGAGGRAGRARAAGGRRAGVRGRAGRARAAGGRRAGAGGRAGRARRACRRGVRVRRVRRACR